MIKTIENDNGSKKEWAGCFSTKKVNTIILQ